METAHAAIRRAALQAVPARHAGDALGRAVFDGFPHGLLVFGADRRLIAVNPAARLLLAPLDVPIDGATCCALLDCRREGSPLQELCLTERAFEEGRPLPDVRVDLTADGEARALWVSTAPLDGRRVLAQIRPGRPGDRRRRTSRTGRPGPRCACARSDAHACWPRKDRWRARGCASVPASCSSS